MARSMEHAAWFLWKRQYSPLHSAEATLLPHCTLFPGAHTQITPRHLHTGRTADGTLDFFFFGVAVLGWGRVFFRYS